MKILQISIILTVILSVLFLLIDRNLFFYGENKFDFYSLPLNFIPESRPSFEGGFVIRDSMGMSIIGTGIRYRQSDFKVAKFQKYAIHKDTVYAQLEGYDRNIYFIQFSENLNSKTGLEVAIKTDEEWVQGKKLFWYEVYGNEGRVRNLITIRTLISIIFISNIILIAFSYIKKLQRNKI
ncbi:MAG: hypothetical protein ED557_11940 [Balneola sp.]|nr:MAG: hypothetical protein ED557_11940 [Balneola sp.]